jgi:MraZ protein
MRFFGKIEAKIDVKSRVFIPAVFRRMLQADGGQTMYLRKDIHQPCLILYPESVWESEMTQLRSRLNKWNPEHQEIFRQFTWDAETVEMDASGRILISKALLQSCGIDTMVLFWGVDDTIEIWPKELLDKPLMDPEAFKQKITAIMSG